MALPRKVATAGTTALLLASPLMASPALAEDGSLTVHGEVQGDPAVLTVQAVDADGAAVSCVDDGQTAQLIAGVVIETDYFWSSWFFFYNGEYWSGDSGTGHSSSDGMSMPLEPSPLKELWVGPGDHSIEAVLAGTDTLSGVLSLPPCSTDDGGTWSGPPAGSPAYEKACNNNNAPEGRGPKSCQA